MNYFNMSQNGLSIELSSFSVNLAQAYVIAEMNGKKLNYNLSGAILASECTVKTEWGDAKKYIYTKEIPTLTFKLMLEIGVKRSFVCLQGNIQNYSGTSISLEQIVLMTSSDFSVASGSIITSLFDSTPPCLLEKQTELVSYLDGVMVYPCQGEGVLIATSGTGLAYAEIALSNNRLRISSSMDGVLLEDGESRLSERVLLLCGDSEECLSEWTGVIGAICGARVHRKPITGWCSWYDQTTNITERHVRDVLEIYRQNSDIFSFDVIQVDDGYQKYDGDWTSNDKFPLGMDQLAKDIKKCGYIPGKWLAPLIINKNIEGYENVKEAIRYLNESGTRVFMDDNPYHPLGAAWLDPTHPKAKQFLASIMKQTAKQGYEYIKIDFNNIGNCFFDKKKTAYQVFHELFDLYRTNVGENVYCLGCTTMPVRAVIGLCDAVRIGPDSHPGGLRNALESLLRFQYCHKVWWNNDPDVTYIKSMVQGRCLGEISGKTEQLHTWHNAIAISGGLVMTSEPLEQPDAKNAWRMMEILIPPVNEKAKVYNFGKSINRDKFGFTARRAYGDFATVMLWNDAEKPKSINISMSDVQLPNGKFCVYSFWENKVIDICKNEYCSPMLEPEHSMQLRLTPLDQSPKIVGSNLHLSCGAAEIANCFARQDGFEIHLNDSGAREGSVFVYLTYEISDMLTYGLDADIVKVDGNIYEIKISNRKRQHKNITALNEKSFGAHNSIIIKYKVQ